MADGPFDVIEFDAREGTFERQLLAEGTIGRVAVLLLGVRYREGESGGPDDFGDEVGQHRNVDLEVHVVGLDLDAAVGIDIDLEADGEGLGGRDPVAGPRFEADPGLALFDETTFEGQDDRLDFVGSAGAAQIVRRPVANGSSRDNFFVLDENLGVVLVESRHVVPVAGDGDFGGRGIAIVFLQHREIVTFLRERQIPVFGFGDDGKVDFFFLFGGSGDRRRLLFNG